MVTNYWAVEVSTVAVGTPLPLGCLDFGEGAHEDILDGLGIDGVIICFYGLIQAIVVVFSHMLLGSPCDGIMVLIDTHGIHHRVVGSLDRLDVISRSTLLQCLQSVHLVRSMKVCLSIPNLPLCGSPGCEVSSPVVVGLVSIGEHVICLNRVCEVLLLNRVQVDPWGRPDQGSIGTIECIEILDESVEGHKVHVGIPEGEITTLGDEEVISLVQIQHFEDIGLHQVGLEVCVEGLKFGVRDDWCIYLIRELTVVIGEAIEVAVTVLYHMRIDLSTVAEMLNKRLPDKFLALV